MGPRYVFTVMARCLQSEEEDKEEEEDVYMCNNTTFTTDAVPFAGNWHKRGGPAWLNVRSKALTQGRRFYSHWVHPLAQEFLCFF